jgi:hypothetical protein
MKTCMSTCGLVSVVNLDKGLFQGCTGTFDLLMNVKLSLFCMKKAKCAGYLFQNKAATTAGLMDNTVQAVEMDLRTGKQHAQEAADSHYSMIRDMWRATDTE